MRPFFRAWKVIIRVLKALRRFSIPLLIFGVAIGGLIALAGVGEERGITGEGSALSGQIEIDGSSTVGPISLAVAEEFGKIHPNVHVPVGVSGTGGGFKRFTRGETLISDASRPIKEIEAETAVKNGIEYVQIPVAFDGLSVVVNPRNRFARCLTTEELRLIWEPGSAIDRWSDIRPEWPDDRIRLYGPGTDSGTFDYFTEAIVGESGASRADYSASEDDNVLVLGVSGDKNALGYFGFAFYAENQDLLSLVGVDSGDGCITPTHDTINDGTYSPLAREIFVYVNTKGLERDEVREFLTFYMENAPDLVSEVGYVPLGADRYSETLEFLAGSAGTALAGG